MKLGKIILLLLTIFLFATNAVGQHLNVVIPDLVVVEDTMDEVDLQAMRDTLKSRKVNIARIKNYLDGNENSSFRDFLKKHGHQGMDTIEIRKEYDRVLNSEEPGQTNSSDYTIHDEYTPQHQKYNKGFWNHVYIGGGYGFELITPQVNDFQIKTMSQIHAVIGKELNRMGGLRLTLGGGWGYQRDAEQWLMRASTRLDYIYNLSAKFNGYNPVRPMDFSLVGGAGLQYTGLRGTGKHFAPEAHMGLQFCFNKPGKNAIITIEPYCGIGSDKIDVSATRNWRGYDLFWGVHANYALYVKDRWHESIFEQQKYELFSKNNDTLMYVNMPSVWRTPWFVETSSGIAMSSSENINLQQSLGSETTISVGRWLSPIIGWRLSGGTRSVKWMERLSADKHSRTIHSASYNTNYLNARIEALLNPLGLLNSFKWENKYGMHIFFGYGYGMLEKCDVPNSYVRTHSESYHAGMQIWYKMTEDLRLFIEPRFTYNVYTIPYKNIPARSMWGDKNILVNAGLSMLIRSPKHVNTEQLDSVQSSLIFAKYSASYVEEYNESKIRYFLKYHGLYIGAGAGLVLLQRHDVDYGGKSINWNGLLFAEYRINSLFSVRGSIDILSLNRRKLLDYTESNTDADGYVTQKDYRGLWNVDTRMAFCGVNAEVNLTNLWSGRMHERKNSNKDKNQYGIEREFELEAFLGPAVAIRLSQKMNLSLLEPPANSNHVLNAKYDAQKNIYWGLDGGIKLSRHIWKGISVYFTPTCYLLYQTEDNMAANVVSQLNIRLYQTYSLGVQYRIGNFHRNRTLLKYIHVKHDKKWKERQTKTIKKEEEKRQERIRKQHTKT